MAPSSPKMFEVWADEECTVRPVVGQEYTELYLQVNAELHEQCPTPDYAENPNGVTMEVCSQKYTEGSEIILYVFIDFVYNLGLYEEGTDLSLATGVYKVEASEPIEIREELLLSSGPDVA